MDASANSALRCISTRWFKSLSTDATQLKTKHPSIAVTFSRLKILTLITNVSNINLSSMVTLEELYLLLETQTLLRLPTNLRILKTRGTDVCIENLSSTHNLRTLDTDTDFYYWHSYGYEVPTLSQLTNLKCLRIREYSEELEIGKLITLTSLKADYIFPRKLIGLTNLTKLHALDTNISTVVSNLTSLRELTTSNISVDYTPFLKKIEVLDFRWNEISADVFGMLPPSSGN
jgi:hypothetical protein